jgi:exosome complex RNA-binding protein Rrp42 (RNase PH superfamily)
VHVYDIGVPKSNTEEIIYLNRGVDIDVKPKLMVTLSGLMIGSKKQAWVTNAEKIIILE